LEGPVKLIRSQEEQERRMNLSLEEMAKLKYSIITGLPLEKRLFKVPIDEEL